MPSLEKFDENEVLKFQMGVLQLITQINDEKRRVSLPSFPKFTSNPPSITQPYTYMIPVSHQAPQSDIQYCQNFNQHSTSNTTTMINRQLYNISPSQSTSSSYSSIDFSTLFN